MMLRKLFSLLSGSIALLLIMVFGCSEDPSDVGVGLLAPQDTLHIESRELSATHDTTFQKRIIGSAGRLLIGKYNDLEAASVVEFSGIPTFAAGVIIDSAIITLRVNYSFRDSSGIYGVAAYNMLNTWNAATFTWDSLAGAHNNTSAGTFARSITPQDTTIRLPIDTALIRTWSQTSTGSLALLSAPNVIGMNLVMGFSNVYLVDNDTRPKLTISYHDSADTTLTLDNRASRAIFVANTTASPPPQSVMLQAGVAYLGVVKFDSLAVPPNVSITKATLELTVDQTSSLTNNFSRDSLIVYLSRKDALPYDSLVLGTVCSPAVSGSEKKFVADVKNIVQQWIGNEPNLGIVVQTYGQYTTLDRFVVYGSGAPAALRPKLKITYTMFP